MKLIIASIVIVGTYAKKTDTSTTPNKDIAGLRGKQYNTSERKQVKEGRRNQELELFGNEEIPILYAPSADPEDVDTTTITGSSGGDLVDNFPDFSTLGDQLAGLFGGGGGDDTDIDTISGVGSVLGGDDLPNFMDAFECGDTCEEENKGVCTSFMMTMDPTLIFEDACNKRCIPKIRMETCEQYCKPDDTDSNAAATAAVARLGFFESAVELMCNDCKFYECCLEGPDRYATCSEQYLVGDIEDQATGDSILDQIAQGLSDVMDGALGDDLGLGDINLDGMLDLNITDALGSVEEVVDSFSEAMEDFLPDISDMNLGGNASDFDLPSIDSDWGVSAQEFIDGLDWSAITDTFGLSGLFEDMQTLLDESMSDSDLMGGGITAVSCDPDTCPIKGLCDMNIDYASLSADNICGSNAFYKCGSGLQEVCAKCDSEGSGGMICSLCSIATCCKEAGADASFEKCALGSPLAEDFIQDDADATPADGSTAEIATTEDQDESENAPTEVDSESSEIPETATTEEDDQSESSVPAGPNDTIEDPGLTEPLAPVQVVSSLEKSDMSGSPFISTTLMYTAAVGSMTMLYYVSF